MSSIEQRVLGLVMKMSTANKENAEIRRLVQKIAGVLVLRCTVICATVWTFVWGTAVLILRFVFAIPQDSLRCGFFSILLVIPVGIIFGIRRKPQGNQVRTLMDSMNQCGGLLMADASTDVGAWRSELQGSTVPVVRWRGR